MNKYQALVHLSLTIAFHTVDENNNLNPYPIDSQNYGKNALYKVSGKDLEECKDKLQLLLDKLGDKLTNE